MIVCNICTLKQSINNSECEACGLPLISAPPQPLNPIRSNSSPPPLDLGTPSRGTPSYRELLTNTNLSHSRPVSNEELEEMLSDGWTLNKQTRFLNKYKYNKSDQVRITAQLDAKIHEDKMKEYMQETQKTIEEERKKTQQAIRKAEKIEQDFDYAVSLAKDQIKEDQAKDDTPQPTIIGSTLPVKLNSDDNRLTSEELRSKRLALLEKNK
tara:strand:- start:304 stop:936 length:633 start_codon:yes stop_codon:yes gene_type:complete